MIGLPTCRRASRSTSPTLAELARRLGRGMLWALVLVLLVRGLAGVLVRREPVAAVQLERPAAPVWPDDEARAFGAAFARAYLTITLRDPSVQGRALAAFVPPELATSIAPELGERSRAETVSGVVFARSTLVDARHALLTYAVTRPSGTRYLTVPVARDDRGGLVVDELPSIAAPPPVAKVATEAPESVSAAERDPLAAIVERFLRAYVAGDAGALSYLVSAGVRIATPGPHGYELVDLASLAQASPAVGRVRELVAAVRVRELGSGAVFAQRYQLRLERRERWYVADINGSKEG